MFVYLMYIVLKHSVFLDIVGSLPLYFLSSDLISFRLKTLNIIRKLSNAKFKLAAHQELHCICGNEEG